MQDYEGWTILEIKGHRKIAGWVSEVEIAGFKMLRIDVPGPGMRILAAAPSEAKPVGPWQVTQWYNGSSVHCMTATTADVAIRFAVNSSPDPVTRWELKEPTPALPEPYAGHAGYSRYDDDHDDDGRYDDREEG